jgi:hypothetical protein
VFIFVLYLLKLRHYLLSSACVVACQADVIRHMLQQPILSGRIIKRAYALIEYDLAYKPLKSIKGQVVADFIIKNSIDQNSDESYNLVSIHPWKLFFDGSAYREGQGVGVVLVSLRGAIFEQSVHFCTNNQAEYEAILLGDSLVVMQQVADVFQCFNNWKLLLSLMILLCNMFPGMKIQWQMISCSEHQVFD